MKKFGIILAIVLFSLSAVAYTEHLTTLHLNQVHSVVMEIPAGKHDVVVRGGPELNVDCRIFDNATRSIVYSQSNATECIGHVELNLPRLVTIEVTSHTSHPVWLQIEIR